jgi:hypothetical protein
LLGTLDSRQTLASVAKNGFEPVINTLKIKPFNTEKIIGTRDDDHNRLIDDFMNKDPQGVKLLIEGIRRESLKNAQIFYLPEGQWPSAYFNFNPVIDDMEKWKKLRRIELGVFTLLSVMEQLDEKGGYWGRSFVELRERTRMARICLALELYRRKHGALPSSLAALHDHELTTDPLNDLPFGYQLGSDHKTFQLYTDAAGHPRIQFPVPSPRSAPASAPR